MRKAAIILSLILSHFGFSQVTDTGDKVGIGTSNPQTKLHILKNNVGIKSIYSSFIVEATDAQLDIISSSSGTWGSSINFIEGNNSSNRDVWSITRQTTDGNGDSSFRINFGVNNQHDNQNKITIKSDGNVGIGTTSPDSKLTVAGKVHAQEVKVTINAGADFVFKDDYNLPDLEDTEVFIKKNKHLPEIASEKEMQEKGIHLAEMNVKLLQKIEELTLYTINQEKRIKNLESKNETLILLVEKLLERTGEE
ncbi:tail fiber protein [Flavivirga sp. 57AJ16]|uniref:tail fiber protein n=1 Tax=Flavivirga sp. 57AJ16 TaxID=3025307 RepID=UPI0023672FB2|nr:tail fiber protein [Flavivirga sp. 57AJ16]MDD7886049.1 tail fiber protein [Flavivirga sp. 57AJ16]